MITIKHKQGIISNKDENKIPKIQFGRHSNGTEWIYFESQEEKESFYATNFPQPKEPQPMEELNPLIEAVKGMTPEQKAELKALLNSET